MVVAPLFLRSDEVVVVTSVGLIGICDFWDVGYSITTHLKHRYAHGYVVGCLEVPSTRVLQVLLLDLEKKGHVEGT